MDKIQNQLDDLDTRLSQIETASQIPRNLETALLERLGHGGELMKYISKWGTATLASGAVTISDGNIKPTSIVVITPQTGISSNPSVDLYAVCSTGVAAITSTLGSDSRVINYLIIF